jgi:GNAT superfamily N-acetyltransferase
LEIRELRRSELDEAARLLSRGMLHNPNHIAAFGLHAERRRQIVEVFFRAVLPGLHTRGMILGAFDGDSLLAVCGLAPPGQCQPALSEKIRILLGLLALGMPGAPVRVLRWARVWSRHEPGVAHWHLGPVAVDAHLQGRGIGAALLGAFCRRVDEAGGLAYLETDKRENVRFYEKQGFVINAEDVVLGVPNWYMSRPAQMKASPQS